MTPLEVDRREFQFLFATPTQDKRGIWNSKEKRPIWKLIHGDWAEFCVSGCAPFTISDLAEETLKTIGEGVRIAMDSKGMGNYLLRIPSPVQGGIPLAPLNKQAEKETLTFIESESKNPGFRLFLEISQANPKPVWKLLHTDWPEFWAEIWVPPWKDPQAGPGANYIHTTLKLMGKTVRIAIDIQRIVTYLKTFRSPEELAIAPHAWRETILHFVTDEEETQSEARESPELDYWIAEKKDSISPYGFELDNLAEVGTGIERAILGARETAEKAILIRLKKEVIMVCKKDRLEEYLDKNELLHVRKRHLSWVVTRKNICSTVDYLYEILLEWDRQLEKKERIYHPRSGFEYRKDGTLWYDYKYFLAGRKQTLIINLNTGESFELAQYPEQIAQKISAFGAAVGFPHFIEFYPREDLGLRFFVGRFELTEANLLTGSLPLSPPDKRQIARWLLSSLALLRKERIVHCGINPMGILFRLLEKGKIDTFFAPSDFERAYFLDDLPQNPFDPKWPECTPPECKPPHEISANEHPNPFAIPIYQLGCCFTFLFKDEPSPQIEALLNGMCDPDPRHRWDELLASQALSD